MNYVDDDHVEADAGSIIHPSLISFRKSKMIACSKYSPTVLPFGSFKQRAHSGRGTNHPFGPLSCIFNQISGHSLTQNQFPVTFLSWCPPLYLISVTISIRPPLHYRKDWAEHEGKLDQIWHKKCPRTRSVAFCLHATQLKTKANRLNISGDTT